MEVDIDKLKNRWIALQVIMALGSDSLETFADLLMRYSESHRHYHDLTHISDCLEKLDLVASQADHPDEIEMAIWFHDVIYRPFSKTNEEDSAEMAKDFLTDRGADNAVIDRVFDLIMVTLHNGVPSSKDGELMVDIDLSILGSDEERYDRYSKNVRKEYRWVPWFLYKKNRKKVLQQFVDREHIFNQPLFREKFEARAKANLQREINSL